MKTLRKILIVIGVAGLILAFGSVDAIDHESIPDKQGFIQMWTGLAAMGAAMGVWRVFMMWCVWKTGKPHCTVYQPLDKPKEATK